MEFKLSKCIETFSFKPPISSEGSWLVGLTSLEVYNYIFIITEGNNKLELYIDTFDEYSFEELKDQLEEILSSLGISPKNLKNDTIGAVIKNAYRNLKLEKSSTDGYIILKLAYASSSFRDFESYQRIKDDLNEHDIQFILKQYIPYFVAH